MAISTLGCIFFFSPEIRLTSSYRCARRDQLCCLYPLPPPLPLSPGVSALNKNTQRQFLANSNSGFSVVYYFATQNRVT